MKFIQKKPRQEIEAFQYGFDKNAEQFIRLCQKNNLEEINEVPRDLLGVPKNAFQAVKGLDVWQVIQHGDWIIKKDADLMVVLDAVFKLFFEKIE